MTNLSFEKAVELSEDEVRECFENARWPDGTHCPRCGSNSPYKITPKKGSKTRKGLYTCSSCRKQFTVTVGTVFESSHVSLKKWLMAICLMSASKKGISAHQIHRMLGITYKSAWFMMHRLRYAMTQLPLKEKLCGTVEVDETYIGGKGHKRGRGSEKKMIVVSLVERNGDVLSKHAETVTTKELKGYIRDNVDKDSEIMTDEFRSYKGLDKEYKRHGVINHGKKQYVNGDIYTNTAEGYFSLLKRGINGIFHHVSKKHLHRYLNEFDFRWNLRKLDNSIKTILTIQGGEGKKLKYCHSL